MTTANKIKKRKSIKLTDDERALLSNSLGKFPTMTEASEILGIDRITLGRANENGSCSGKTYVILKKKVFTGDATNVLAPEAHNA